MSATIGTLSERLTRIKEVGGLRNEDLARIAGCSNSLIGHLCTGTRDNPAVSYLTAIARDLDLDLDWLADGHGKEPTDIHLRRVGARVRAAEFAEPTIDRDPAFDQTRDSITGTEV